MSREQYSAAVDELVRLAIAEDIGSGDLTTSMLVHPAQRGHARVIAKEALVIAGYAPFARVFSFLCSDVACRFLKAEGSAVSAGDVIAELDGPFHVLLTRERTAMNFLQHLSGVATATSRYVQKVRPFGAQLLDTRKTTPAWRALEKEAVLLGGGKNHRMGLYDAILIKENHIAACGGITRAIARARELKNPDITIEVEVRNLDELQEALDAQPDIILLDNMSVEDMKKAVDITAGRADLEASGNVNLDTIEEIASTGVTYISVGAITHSAKASDLSMLIEPVGDKS